METNKAQRSSLQSFLKPKPLLPDLRRSKKIGTLPFHSMASSLLRAASRRSKTSLILPPQSGFDPLLSESQRFMCSNVRPGERSDGIGGFDLSKYPLDMIRNFANRLPELSGSIKKGHGQAQYLDKLQGCNLLKSRVVVFPKTVTCSFVTDNQLNRCMSTAAQPDADFEGEDVPSAPEIDTPHRVKFKRLDKTAKQIMTILDKEAVDKLRSEKEIPDIRPGCIVELKVEVPENKRRVSTLKGIVIARKNAGLNTTFRLRRLVAGVGVESVFPLYSPNIKEMKILDRKKVRRAKLYYLRDRMNALKK